MEVNDNDILDSFFTMLKEKEVPPFRETVMKEARRQMRRGFFSKTAYATLEKQAREYPWSRAEWDSCVAGVTAGGGADSPEKVCAAMMWAEWGIGPWAGKGKRGSLDLKGYPNFGEPYNFAAVNLPKWQQLRIKIHSLLSTMPKYSQDECVQHYTKDMPVLEKERFVQWLKYEDSGERYKYPNREGNMKTAQVQMPIAPNILADKKSDLAKRTRLILKELSELSAGGLIAKEMYEQLSTILHEFDMAIHRLASAQMIDDLSMRNIRILNKQGMYKQANILRDHFNDIPLKIAGALEEDITKLDQASIMINKRLDMIRSYDIIKDLNRAAQLLDEADVSTKEIYNAVSKLLGVYNSVEESLAEVSETVKRVLSNKKTRLSLERPAPEIPVEPTVVTPGGVQ